MKLYGSWLVKIDKKRARRAGSFCRNSLLEIAALQLEADSGWMGSMVSPTPFAWWCMDEKDFPC